jgi:hypothetical protein
MRLRTCSQCRRHVAIDERACVFCHADLAAARPASDPLVRLSRAAVFVAGVAGGVGGAACWTNQSGPRHVSSKQSTRTVDAGVAPDAVVGRGTNNPDNFPDPDYQDHPCYDPGNGQPPVCAPYGAPPARRRLV